MFYCSTGDTVSYSKCTPWVALLGFVVGCAENKIQRERHWLAWVLADVFEPRDQQRPLDPSLLAQVKLFDAAIGQLMPGSILWLVKKRRRRSGSVREIFRLTCWAKKRRRMEKNIPEKHHNIRTLWYGKFCTFYGISLVAFFKYSLRSFPFFPF